MGEGEEREGRERGSDPNCRPCHGKSSICHSTCDSYSDVSCRALRAAAPIPERRLAGRCQLHLRCSMSGFMPAWRCRTGRSGECFRYFIERTRRDDFAEALNLYNRKSAQNASPAGDAGGSRASRRTRVTRHSASVATTGSSSIHSGPIHRKSSC